MIFYRNRDRLFRLQKDCYDFLLRDINRMREEIQKTFAQSQDQVARTHKVKEECMKLLNHTEESP